MTDKQIIIDGVDVSGCCHYNKKTGICSNGFRVDEIPYCNCFTCNYKRWKVAEKQLKRKEQECERLKKWLPIVTRLENEFENFEKAKAIDYKSYIEQIFIELDKLKAENDELRKNLVDKHTSRCFRLVTHREFDKLIMETVQLRQENKKLKQTLTEIKEIVFPKNQLIITDSPIILKIQEKISEVEN